MSGTGKTSVEKKSGRIATIALGIVCISLVVVLVGVIVNYNSIINAKDNPYLIKVDLWGTDNRPSLSSPYLNVHGYIVNVNKNWAYNCKLHILAYQSDGVVAIDTYINLGIMTGEYWKAVNSNCYYTGSALATWTITPEWTSS